MVTTYSNKSGSWCKDLYGTWVCAEYSVPDSVKAAAAYYKCGYIVYDSATGEARPADGTPCGLFRGAPFNRSRGYKPFFDRTIPASRPHHRADAVETAIGVAAAVALISILKR